MVGAQKAVIIGAGGHAKVVIEILREAGAWELAGCTACSPCAADVLGIPVLGDDGVLPKLRAGGVSAAFVAIGDNRARQEASRRAVEAGFRLLNAVSARATVSPSAQLGHGVAVMPGAVINAETRLGDGAIVNTGATVDHDCRIGAYAHIAPGVHLAGCVGIGEGAFVGIGASAIPGVIVGPWAVVGAGAALLHDVPAGATAVGVPARMIRRSQGDQ